MTEQSADYWAGYRDALVKVQGMLEAQGSLIGLVQAATAIRRLGLPEVPSRPQTVTAAEIGWIVTVKPVVERGANEVSDLLDDG